MTDTPRPLAGPPVPRDYLTELGYVAFDDDTELYARRAQCVHCLAVFDRSGDVMRGHRRRCPVHRADPYTPAVCDS